MLKFFSVEHTFYKLRVSLYVDCADPRNPAASLTVTYDRRIVVHGDLLASDALQVATPDKAEAWLSRDAGERGNWIEAQEYSWRIRSQVAA